MAEVTVSSWEEFVQAVGVAGDTVICPSGAVWDMNDIEPEGHDGNINIACAAIAGNNTTIRNLHIFGNFISVNAAQINGLNMINWVCESDNFWVYRANTSFYMCQFSGLIAPKSNSTQGIFYGAYSIYLSFVRCSFNIACDLATSSTLYLTPASNYISARYCRVRLNFPNYSAGSFFAIYNMSYCELYAYVPQCRGFGTFHYNACVIRGNFGSATESSDTYRERNILSVYTEEALPNINPSKRKEMFIQVREADLSDPAYLRSIGFAIGED